MTYFYSNILKEDKALNNLRIAKVSGKTWIDAGSGDGSYTIPLSQIVSKVIAIDQDKNRIDTLQTLMQKKKVSNIQCIIGNFFTLSLNTEPVDGILFAFSLHYSSEPYKAVINLKKYLKPFGLIIIIDYDRIDPVPWIPFPINKNAVLGLLGQAKIETIDTIFQNNRYYIIKGII